MSTVFLLFTSWYRTLVKEIDEIRAGKWDDRIRAKLSGQPLATEGSGWQSTPADSRIGTSAEVQSPQSLVIGRGAQRASAPRSADASEQGFSPCCVGQFRQLILDGARPKSTGR